MTIMCRACRVVNHIIKCKFSSDLVGIYGLGARLKIGKINPDMVMLDLKMILWESMA